MPSVVFDQTYNWSNDFWGPVSIHVTVTEDAPGYEDQYLWEYIVTNDPDNNMDVGYFALPAFDPEEFGLDGIRLTIGNLDATPAEWEGDVGEASDPPPYVTEEYIWWDFSGNGIEPGHSATFSFTTVPTPILTGQGIVKEATGISPTILGTLAAPEAPNPLEVTTLDDMSTLDDGLVSLREAVGYANTKAVADPDRSFTITFGARAQEGFTQLQSQLSVNANVRIVGPGADKVEVRGLEYDADNPNSCRVFSIGHAKVVTIEKLAIKTGHASEADPNGGAIKVNTDANLTLRQCYVGWSSASGDGGGIWVGPYATLKLVGTTVFGNLAKGNGGGIAAANAKEVFLMATAAGDPTVVSSNIAHHGGGLWLTGTGDVNTPRYFITKSRINSNSAESTDANGNGTGGNGGGLYLEWPGNTLNKKVADISDTEFDGNNANYGFAGGIYLRAVTTFGAGVKILNSRAAQKDGIGINLGGFTKKCEGLNGLEVKGCILVDPPEGAGNLGTVISDLSDDHENDPSYLPSAIYIEEGSEFILFGAVIMDNEGVGVRGEVVSLGYNYAENSLATSWGWIETDDVT